MYARTAAEVHADAIQRDDSQQLMPLDLGSDSENGGDAVRNTEPGVNRIYIYIHIYIYITYVLACT